MPRTTRPITLATKAANAALIAKYQDEFQQMVDEEMTRLGYGQVTVTRWTKKME